MSLVKVGRSCSILRENSREAGEGELMKLNERLIPLPKKELKSGTSPVNVLFAEAKLHCKVEEPCLGQLGCLADGPVQAGSLRTKFFPAGVVSQRSFAGATALGLCRQHCKTKKELACEQLAVASCRSRTGNQSYGVKQSSSNSCEGETWKTGKGKFQALTRDFGAIHLGGMRLNDCWLSSACAIMHSWQPPAEILMW